MSQRRLLSIATFASAFLGACLFVQDLGSTGGSDTGDDPGVDARAAGNDASADMTDVTDVTDGGTNASTNDGAPRVDLYGALPGGYCCTDDEQCRYRHCLPSDAGRMCFDECTAETQASCNRPGIDFTCDLSTPPLYVCVPIDPFTCLDPSAFIQGGKDAGGCCADRNDGLRGQECKSNLCMTYRDAPATCTRICEAGVDCPTGWQCKERILFSICVPPLGTACE